jgi:hypothetical protein
MMAVAALSRRLLAPLLLAAGSQAATCGDVDGGGSGSAHVADADCGEGLRYASASAALVCAGPVCDVAGNEADRGACCEAYVDLLLLAADVSIDDISDAAITLVRPSNDPPVTVRVETYRQAVTVRSELRYSSVGGEQGGVWQGAFLAALNRVELTAELTRATAEWRLEDLAEVGGVDAVEVVFVLDWQPEDLALVRGTTATGLLEASGFRARLATEIGATDSLGDLEPDDVDTSVQSVATTVSSPALARNPACGRAYLVARVGAGFSVGRRCFRES